MSKQASTNRFGLIATYRAVAVFALNCALFFLLLNAGAVLLLSWLPDPELQGALTYGLDRLERAYPGRSRDEIRQLLEESWSRTYRYEPFTQFREGEFSGRFVNVSAEGFRTTGHGLPWPPESERTNVFVFGGSTTFGYGLGDEETIPARLQEALEPACGERVAVYNLARSNYYSSQEGVLFQRLLARGIRPEAAVFVDGLNDFAYGVDEPKFTGRLTYLMNETTVQTGRRFFVKLPLTRLLKRWLPQREESRGGALDTAEAEAVIERWLRNRQQIRAVADAAVVETLFVWQPIPSWGYDLDHHVFVDAEERGQRVQSTGYEVMSRRRLEPELGLDEDFLWLADMQRGRGELLYVDKVHYSAAFSTEIAQEIADAVAARLCSAEGEVSAPS